VHTAGVPQGYALKNQKTLYQLVKMQSRGEHVSSYVGIHLVAICVDKNHPPLTLFEQWIPDLDEQVVDEYKELHKMYNPPADLIFLHNKSEIVLQFKSELDEGAINVADHVAKSQTAGGVDVWPGMRHSKNYYARIVHDIRKSARAPRCELPPPREPCSHSPSPAWQIAPSISRRTCRSSRRLSSRPRRPWRSWTLTMMPMMIYRISATETI
jgi:hypothetical protein